MTGSDSDQHSSDPYDRLERRSAQLYHLESSAALLRWDQEVVMPDGGTPNRSKQLATISAITHEKLTDDSVGDWIDAIDVDGLNDEKAAVIREINRERERAVRVPTDLVEAISETAAQAFEAWHEAKETDTFETFAPLLEELVDLRREYAAYIDPDADPYSVLFADYEPYLPVSTAERILDRLRPQLVTLIDEIEDHDPGRSVLRDGEFPASQQEAFVRDVLDELGFDWNRGRLDTSPHPFSTGTPYDARITTRFDEADLLDGLMSSIHEFGHASYTLGLPTEYFGTPLARPRDLTVHESQSRLWENHIGRSRSFWERILPIAIDRFPALAGTTVDDAYRSVNRVYDDNPIRVEADELTYHLHIIVRFEIERELFGGSLEVAEIPSVWNDKMETYLGIRPETDTEGCLQDVHWSHGSFGYFPTYTLGSVLAAQLFEGLETESETLEADIRDGSFETIRDWLDEQIYQYGCRYTTPDLIEVATGRTIEADPFLDYIERKYRPLYGQ